MQRADAAALIAAGNTDVADPAQADALIAVPLLPQAVTARMNPARKTWTENRKHCHSLKAVRKMADALHH